MLEEFGVVILGIWRKRLTKKWHVDGNWVVNLGERDKKVDGKKRHVAGILGIVN